MKTIPLELAVTILEEASAVIIDNVVTYPSVYYDETTGDGDVFMDLTWEDDESQQFEVLFA